MPYIKAKASPYSSLKKRPVANAHLEPNEIVKIPKGKQLGVTFPYTDSDKPIQAVRLVGNASDFGLKAGEVWYAYTEEWLVNGTAWNPNKAKPLTVFDRIKSILKGKKQYEPTLKPGDYHLMVVDDENYTYSTMGCVNHLGKVLWSKNCLARGQNQDPDVYAGDTPTGLYYLGECWISDPDDVATCKPYGIHCFDLVTVEDGEDKTGRAGICLHGGGSALGYDTCISDEQELVPTFGCIRMYNSDLRDVIYPLYTEARNNDCTIWVSVYQV